MTKQIHSSIEVAESLGAYLGRGFREFRYGEGERCEMKLEHCGRSITTPNCAISINTRTENWIDTWMQALRITALAPKHQSVVRTTYLWMKKLITTNAIMPVPTSETFGHYCLSR